MQSSTVCLKLESISKVYEGAQDGAPLHVLQNIDLEVNTNQTIAVIGPSGSGKSTLLNLIGTLDQPSSGTIFLEGDDLGGYDEKTLASIRNQKIGFIFQDHHLLPQCSVLENVLVPTLVHPSSRSPETLERAKTLLEQVGLSDRVRHRPSQLSGGERQRVAYVRALINEPVLLLADEPTGALDRENAARLMDLLVDINKARGLTSIVVTHALELVQNMDRVYELKNGQLQETSRRS